MRKKKKTEPTPIPREVMWLAVKLSARFNIEPKTVALEFGRIARAIAQKPRERRISNTTCIACGGWIPRERENRRQHTCSNACQEWYRRLLRSIDAGKECRYCGHGLPKNAQKSILSHRPTRSKVDGRPELPDAGEGDGAPRHGTVIRSHSVGIGRDEVSE